MLQIPIFLFLETIHLSRMFLDLQHHVIHFLVALSLSVSVSLSVCVSLSLKDLSLLQTLLFFIFTCFFVVMCHDVSFSLFSFLLGVQ